MTRSPPCFRCPPFPFINSTNRLEADALEPEVEVEIEVEIEVKIAQELLVASL